MFPLLFIGFSGFFTSICWCNSRRDAFWVGWWFGFGHFVTGLYWISYSLLVEPERFAWLTPFAVSLIPAVLAVYTGLVGLAVWMLPFSGWRRVTAFSCIWVLAEMLRAHLFTGFPWNLAGYAWAFSDVMLQSASVWGVFGLSFMAVLAASMPGALLRRNGDAAAFSAGSWKPLACIVFLVLMLFVWGSWRLHRADEAPAPQTGIMLRLVQPNIPQRLKWDPEARADALMRHLELTSPSGAGRKPEAVIWPEAALPFVLEEEPELRRRMAEALPRGGYLITGAMRREEKATRYAIWNSVQVMNDEGKIVEAYDKHALVPFGEFVPFRKYLPFVKKITHGSVDFSRGPGPATLRAGNMPPFSPLVCYEGIFSGHVLDEKDPPQWLLNVTNDAWFGDSPGPYQHFHMARVRAAEEGLPLVRVANTGISGVADAYGRIVAATRLGERKTMDIALPSALKERTGYRIYGEWLPGSLMLLILAGVSFPPLFRKNSPRTQHNRRDLFS